MVVLYIIRIIVREGVGLAIEVASKRSAKGKHSISRVTVGRSTVALAGGCPLHVDRFEEGEIVLVADIVCRRIKSAIPEIGVGKIDPLQSFRPA